MPWTVIRGRISFRPRSWRRSATSSRSVSALDRCGRSSRIFESGAFTVDCGDSDFARVGALVDRYADLPLGFSDAAVIACAERHRGRVMTLDRRAFDVVGREVSLTLLP